ncbi:predicted protein [Nematostella vectensis]|uniref:G-protein coupled receptors family 1 profile domain-containing protein n=1 Tax=Nematostella vectensis TaxID=45351 RepID=A7STD9_NEMVE|nr:predicted protein [Nematostella vectensis]|eukprot:XP_001625131.1 predicted protein [Nematostella vectensis]
MTKGNNFSGKPTPAGFPFAISQPIYISEACVIFIGNSLALAVFLSKTFRVKKSSYLLINQTVADLLVGLTICIVAANISENYKQHFLYKGSQIVLNLCIGTSVLSFTSIAMERGYAILAPFKHRLLGSKAYFIAILLTWISSLLFNIETTFKKPNNVAKTIKLACGIICTFIVFFCYLAIWIKVKFFTPLRNARRDASNTKLTITLSLVTLASLICSLPYNLFVIYSFLSNQNTETTKTLESGFLLVFYLDSFVNVLVYSIRMDEFRQGMNKLLTTSCLCRQSASPVRRTQQSTERFPPSVIMMNDVSPGLDGVPSPPNHYEGTDQPSLGIENAVSLDPIEVVQKLNEKRY